MAIAVGEGSLPGEIVQANAARAMSKIEVNILNICWALVRKFLSFEFNLGHVGRVSSFPRRSTSRLIPGDGESRWGDIGNKSKPESLNIANLLEELPIPVFRNSGNIGSYSSGRPCTIPPDVRQTPKSFCMKYSAHNWSLLERNRARSLHTISRTFPVSPKPYLILKKRAASTHLVDLRV